jgi:hypothetical protein
MPEREKVSTQLIIFYVAALLVSSVANSISFKQLLNHYKTRPDVAPEKAHDYEFFVNQVFAHYSVS